MLEDEKRHRPIAQNTIMEFKFGILLEENEEIDIQALQEEQKTCEIKNLDDAKWVIRKNEDNITKLIKVVKQLDKKIK